MFLSRAALRWTAVAAVLVAVSTSSIAVAAQDMDTDQNQCGMYLAVSSTSTADDTTWGVYAGRTIAQEAPVGFPEVGINIFHLKANVAFQEGKNGKTSSSEVDFLNKVVDFLEAFIWVPDAAGARFESPEGRTVTAIPGAGVLGGFNPKLTNAVWNHSSAYFRPAWGEELGTAHAGRGAYSNFFNVGLQSTTEIVAGSEVFLDYGENWAEEDKKEELNKDDHTKIDATIVKMIAFFEKHKDELEAESKLQIYNFLIKDIMSASIGVGKGKKVAALMPPTPDALQKVMDDGGSLAYSQPTVYRKVEWLEEHGRCMDNIRPGTSTIPTAGRGAFATRTIAKDGLVSPVPLIQIPDKAILNMHDVTPTGDGDYVRESDDVTGTQLVLNYCYGHPKSKMVLLPTGSSAGFINHSKKPNAKMVWSSHQHHNKVWMKTNPRKLVEEQNAYIGLMMEIVALRDIKEGEEIFIDYGDEWQAAWDAHVASWNKKVEKGDIPEEWPVRALDMNAFYEHMVYKTEVELETEDYPDNVNLKAFLMLLEGQGAGTVEDPKIWGEAEHATAYDSDNLNDMIILDREKVQGEGLIMPYNYTIKWTNNAGSHTFVKDVPHQAFVFVDAPGTGDQFTDGSFRHFIGIPDDIFPAGVWRNQK
jgi:hypothetical protein